MKKFLLLSALAFGAIAANAQSFAETFKVTFNGEEVKDGQELMMTEMEDFVSGEWADMPMGYEFKGDVDVELRNGTAAKMQGSLDLTDMPTLAEYQTSLTNPAANGGFEFGNPSLCYMRSDGMGNCFAGDSSVPGNLGFGVCDLEDGQNLAWQIHLGNCDSKTPKTKVLLTLTKCDGDGNAIAGETMKLTLKFGDDSAVEEVEAEFNGVPEYYTLQGVRVANPDKGIYIVKRGAKVQKEFVR